MNVLVDLLLEMHVDFALVLKFFLFFIEAGRDGGWHFLLALHQILVFLEDKIIINVLQLKLFVGLCL